VGLDSRLEVVLLDGTLLRIPSSFDTNALSRIVELVGDGHIRPTSWFEKPLTRSASTWSRSVAVVGTAFRSIRSVSPVMASHVAET
jgi:hypothetical protein